jgi:hypothetical protein
MTKDLNLTPNTRKRREGKGGGGGGGEIRRKKEEEKEERKEGRGKREGEKLKDVWELKSFE